MEDIATVQQHVNGEHVRLPSTGELQAAFARNILGMLEHIDFTANISQLLERKQRNIERSHFSNACSDAEKYFSRSTTTLAARSGVAILCENDNPVALMKKLEERTILCTQTSTQQKPLYAGSIVEPTSRLFSEALLLRFSPDKVQHVNLEDVMSVMLDFYDTPPPLYAHPHSATKRLEKYFMNTAQGSQQYGRSK